LEGKRVFKSATIATMWARSPEGNASRALGWDVSSSFSRTASPFFPPEAVGHLGFTGTSVWIDPLTRSYLILLTNRVHPSGGVAAREAVGDLHARARPHRRRQYRGAARPRRDHRAAGVEPLRQYATPDRLHAARPRPDRVRHPGRGRALLHVPHNARLRDGGGSARGSSRARARPAQSHHGSRRRGPADGSRPRLVYGAPSDSRAHRHDHRRVRAHGGRRAEHSRVAHDRAARGLGAWALVRRDG